MSMEKPAITMLHWGNIGDTWASLPAVRECARKTGRKIIFYLKADHPAEYYQGATHPTRNANDEFVCLNEKAIEMMIPLLKAQPYIEDAKIWNNEPVDWDLNQFRMIQVGLPHTSINRWYFYAFPDFACDLSETWMTVPETEKNFAREKILINRTERYTDPRIGFEFLKPYEDDCLFVGTMREYNNFCMGSDLNIRKLNVSNFLEYAQAVDQCDFYISNQSQGFQIAEGMKKPRILETCLSATNVIPIGKDAYDFISQDGLEYAFHRLNGTFKEYIAGKIDEMKKIKATKEAAFK